MTWRAGASVISSSNDQSAAVSYQQALATAQQFGAYDVDALYAYFQANGPISPTPVDRIKRK